jgi:hypothetical protein
MQTTDYVSLLIRIQQIQAKIDAVVEHEVQNQNTILSKLSAGLKNKAFNPDKAWLRAAPFLAIISLGIYYKTGFKTLGMPIGSFLFGCAAWQVAYNFFYHFAGIVSYMKEVSDAHESFLNFFYGLNAVFISLSVEPQSGARYIAISIPIYDEALKISPAPTDSKDVADLTTDDLIARALYQQHDPKDLRDLVLEFITSSDSDEVLVRGSIREPSGTNHPND